MKNRLTLFFFAAILLWGVHNPETYAQTATNIIPIPASVEMNKGTFRLDGKTIIIADTTKKDIKHIAERLKHTIDSATGYELPVHLSTGSKTSQAITLILDNDHLPYMSSEGYFLSVSGQQVQLKAPTTAGLFYGMQSLLQLLPAEIYQTDYTLVPQDTEWTIPAVTIKDHPRFKYRGLHLDVSRHFFPVSFIKEYIDLLAMHKMNRFHWHLTDDQGWRIEIKQYPKLTEVGAWRDSTLVGHYGTERYDDKRYGGYYTQDEIKEVVQYAKERHVTIIPEIEMPGHASAALAAYPEMGCEPDKNYHVQSTWGIFEDIFCPREETFTFLENILTEVMELFPSKYIHIGGDEAPKTAWENSALAQQVIEQEGLKNEHELQSYFITRIEKFLNEHGRYIIGWDEILEGGLAPNATVMSWRGEQGGITAAQQGHDVIMAPGSHLYLDHYQSRPPESEPLAIGGYSPLEKVYRYNPVPDTLSRQQAKHILGAQGNVWTEYMHSGSKVEYMAYPRAAALAEIVWSPEEKQNWDDFLRRLQTQFKRFEIMEVNAAEHFRNEENNKKPPQNIKE